MDDLDSDLELSDSPGSNDEGGSVFDDVITYKKGDVIFCEGEPSSYLYLIKSGKVVVVRKDGNRLQHLTTLKTKDFLGELSMFSDDKRSASAVAAEQTEIVIVKKSDIKKVLKTCPEWITNIMVTICDRMRDSMEIISEHKIVDDTLVAEAAISNDDVGRFRKSIDDYMSKKGLS